MQLSEALMLAGIHEVESRGWARCTLETFDGAVCAAGGLNAAAYGKPLPGPSARPIGGVIPCNACWADRLELHVALHDFAVRMARGEVRHPVQEARRILGIPLVTDTTTAMEGTTTDRSA